MDPSWRFFGEITHRDPEQTTDLLHAVAGWIEEPSPTEWILKYNDPDPIVADVLYTREDDGVLLKRATSVGLKIFAFGSLFVAGSSHLVKLNGMQFWLPGNVDDDIAYDWRLTWVAQRVLNNSRKQVLIQWLLKNSFSTPPKASFSHPSIYKAVPSLTRFCFSLVKPLLFVLNREALDNGAPDTISGIFKTHMGKCDVWYNHCTNMLQTRREATSSSESPTIIHERGAVVYGENTTELISFATAFAQVAPTTTLASSSFCEKEGGTLILAPRWALFSLAEALGQNVDLIASNLQEYRRKCEGNSLNIVVLASELFNSNDPTRYVDSVDYWRRLIIVDWPLVLERSLPKSSFTLGIASTDELSRRLLFDTRSAAKSIGDLLGIPSEGLGDPEALNAILKSRFWAMDEMPSTPRTVEYDMKWGPVPDDEEERFCRGAKGVHLMRSLVFPAFATIRGPFKRVKNVKNVEDITDCFARTATAFTTRSIEDAGDSECPICYEKRADTITVCGHWFCAGCLSTCLARQVYCPICKGDLHPRYDVVSIGPSFPSSDSQMAVLPFLADCVRNVPGKVVVIASFSELHDKVCKSLTTTFGVSSRSRSGSATQIMKCDKDFNDGNLKVMMVDPSSVPCRWSRFQNVEQIFVLYPLYQRGLASCCQVKEVLAACTTSAAPKVTAIIRRGCDSPIYRRSSSCAKGYGESDCRTTTTCVHFVRA